MGLVAGTKVFSLRLDFEAKMASSHDGSRSRGLLQGLVASCVPTCSELRLSNEGSLHKNNDQSSCSV